MFFVQVEMKQNDHLIARGGDRSYRHKIHFCKILLIIYYFKKLFLIKWQVDQCLLGLQTK
jgi:hypothetical protein